MNNIRLLIIVIAFLINGCGDGPDEIQQYGMYEMYEISFEASFYSPFQFPKVNFVKPDGSITEVDGFYDGGKMFKARAYCNQKGIWRWEVQEDSGSKNSKGKFKVVDSDLKGKLKKHPDDPYQFAFDNNDWFLHIGDTGYRYLTKTELKWKEYIDQAKKMGATKIRTWFCSSRHNVGALFDEKRESLNLPYWQEIDKRIAYALEQYPGIILQLIPFSEDTEELKRYYVGDSISFTMLRYAQARFSAYPNIIWCISNDREIVEDSVVLSGRRVYKHNIDKIGNDMVRREPWGTLITNHQSRFRGYSFVNAPWSDIITLEDLDQVDGRLIAEYRSKGTDPVVNDEDRYEMYREPEHPRYYFRRLMWASLLSGGHATYGGIATYEPYEENQLKGVQGYFDVGLEGADDFLYISNFFAETGLTLVDMQPDDDLVGNDPQRFKCIHNDSTYIIYLANPDNTGEPESKGNKSLAIRNAGENSKTPTISLMLPERNI